MIDFEGYSDIDETASIKQLGKTLAAKVKGALGTAAQKYKFRKVKTNEKALRSVCTVDLQGIFALLHAKAVDAANKKL